MMGHGQKGSMRLTDIEWLALLGLAIEFLFQNAIKKLHAGSKTACGRL